MSEPKQCCGSVGARHKKGCTSVVETKEGAELEAAKEFVAAEPKVKGPTEMEVLLKEVAALKAQAEEDQKKLKMLYDVADKGRIFSWEQRQQTDKKPQKVKLSTVGNNIVVGWRTVRDELISDPRSGRTIGENQEYELLLLDKEGGKTTKRVEGYLNFSNIRYENRIEATVLSKSVSFDGKTSLELGLPDGRTASLDAAFVN